MFLRNCLKRKVSRKTRGNTKTNIYYFIGNKVVLFWIKTLSFSLYRINGGETELPSLHYSLPSIGQKHLEREKQGCSSNLSLSMRLFNLNSPSKAAAAYSWEGYSEQCSQTVQNVYWMKYASIRWTLVQRPSCF